MATNSLKQSGLGIVSGRSYRLRFTIDLPQIGTGPQMVTNGTFAVNDTGWTVGSGWTHGSAVETFTFSATTGDILSSFQTGYISNSGSGYTVGDFLTLGGGDGNCVIHVLAVNGSGSVDSWEVTTAGTNYPTGSQATTGGTGTGARFVVNFVALGTLTQTVNLVNGTTYQFSAQFAITNPADNISLVAYYGTTIATSQIVLSTQTAGAVSQTFTAIGNNKTLFITVARGSATSGTPTGSITNVSIQIPGSYNGMDVKQGTQTVYHIEGSNVV